MNLAQPLRRILVFYGASNRESLSTPPARNERLRFLTAWNRHVVEHRARRQTFRIAHRIANRRVHDVRRGHRGHGHHGHVHRGHGGHHGLHHRGRFCPLPTVFRRLLFRRRLLG